MDPKPDSPPPSDAEILARLNARTPVTFPAGLRTVWEGSYADLHAMLVAEGLTDASTEGERAAIAAVREQP